MLKTKHKKTKEPRNFETNNQETYPPGPQHTDSHPCTRPPSWGTGGNLGDTRGRTRGEGSFEALAPPRFLGGPGPTKERTSSWRSIREKFKRHFWFLFAFRMVFLWLLWFVIGLKWLIKACGWFPIFCSTLLELSKSSPNMDPWTPYIS